MYISKKQLKGFDSYKYSCKDTSPLANYVMHPFWNQFVKLFPRWVAPNVMTFGGFLLLVLQYAVLSFYDPVYDAVKQDSSIVVIPTWVWWFSLFAQFFSHTLDGCDGKQARRTNTSSPLGELFDHGIDSWCVSFFTLNVISIFGKDSIGIEQLYFCHIGTMFAFIISHWEKYNTGVLYLPWAYDLSQVTLAIVYLITAINGVDFWKSGIFGISYCLIFQVMTYGSIIVVTVPAAIYNIYLAYSQGQGKHTSILEACLPLISPFLLFGILTSWVYLSPSNILEAQPRLVTFLNGTIFSNIVARLIVAQMSNTRCQPLNVMVPVTFVAFAASVFFNDAKLELYFITAVLGLFIIAHVNYAVVVVLKLANHLKIQVFSIKTQID